MNFYCHSLDLYLTVDKNFILQLVTEAREHYPKEYGGILVGQYSEDKKNCYVKETILPIEYKSSKYFFERGRVGLVEKLTTYYNGSPRLIYLGEWHTHPDGSPVPSNTDKHAMKTIANDEHVTISNPILLIIGLTIDQYQPVFYLQTKNTLISYEQQD